MCYYHKYVWIWIKIAIKFVVLGWILQEQLPGQSLETRCLLQKRRGSNCAVMQEAVEWVMPFGMSHVGLLWQGPYIPALLRERWGPFWGACDHWWGSSLQLREIDLQMKKSHIHLTIVTAHLLEMLDLRLDAVTASDFGFSLWGVFSA